VLHCTRQERLAWHKNSSLFGPYVSYEENEVLNLKLREEVGDSTRITTNFTHNYDTWIKMVCSEKHSSLSRRDDNDAEKSFITLFIFFVGAEPSNCRHYKTFYARNLPL
jgi:hypothetical protein